MPCLCPDCAFITRDLPALTPLPGAGELWRVDCHWLSPLVNGVAVLIRRSFTTDGASIPRVAWRVIGHPFAKDMLPHALGHDGLYAAELLSRKEADDWMLTSMALAEDNFPGQPVSWAKRNAVWSAVRTGGGFVWRGHTPESVAEARRLVSLVRMPEYDALRNNPSIHVADALLLAPSSGGNR